MKLSDFFAPENIVADLAATRKEEAIQEMVRQLCASGALPKAQAAGVEKAILRREELGSTGIGKGVAVPHAKVVGVKGVLGAFGRSRHGVEFNSLDGQPVYPRSSSSSARRTRSNPTSKRCAKSPRF